MLELYFIFYRVPKMMTRLARERGRSAITWSFIGIAVWIGSEIVVLFGLGVLYGICAIAFAWPARVPGGYQFVSYLLALAAALISVTIVSRILTRKPGTYPDPPPPPDFHSESNRDI